MRTITKGYMPNEEDAVVKQISIDLDEDMKILAQKYFKRCKDNNVSPDTYQLLMINSAYINAMGTFMEGALQQMKRNAQPTNNYVSCKFCGRVTTQEYKFDDEPLGGGDYGDYKHTCDTCGAVGEEIFGHGISWKKKGEL